jgi:hypothetical protein
VRMRFCRDGRPDDPDPFDSPGIDAAMAAVMAHDRAAALAGVTRDSIYL